MTKTSLHLKYSHTFYILADLSNPLKLVCNVIFMYEKKKQLLIKMHSSMADERAASF